MPAPQLQHIAQELVYLVDGIAHFPPNTNRTHGDSSNNTVQNIPASPAQEGSPTDGSITSDFHGSRTNTATDPPNNHADTGSVDSDPPEQVGSSPPSPKIPSPAPPAMVNDTIDIPSRRDVTSAELCASLGMTAQDFEEFRTITRQTHRRFRRTSFSTITTPSSRIIADATIDWDKIPPHLQQAMTDDVIRRCGRRSLFPAIWTMEVIEHAVGHRLSILRRQWQSTWDSRFDVETRPSASTGQGQGPGENGDQSQSQSQSQSPRNL
ncbi:hypothetical protein A1O1_07957 [Capronia coronata CBS 617.96]|uniref:Uncharacterized protein n=1 Tax=Capronia coronata CBS 617.96 TaxID=1182541 RepID=W9XMZ9_9EURO|nr:uncharacterized protein A1O1_07957 [Capronia coronata CBS 617.96]EXJ81892.1 hypothetical protein A1O1_07957 [Capronia coronata CBS 617.96]